MTSDSKEADLAELLESVHFLNPTEVNIACSICSEVDVVRWLAPCRHEVCTPCLDNNADDSDEFLCPFHGTVCKKQELVKKVTRYQDVENVAVRCKNKSRGCYLTLPLKLLKAHEKVCPMKNSKCTSCGLHYGDSKKALLKENEGLKERLQQSYEEIRMLKEENEDLRTRLAKAVQEFESLKKSLETTETSREDVVDGVMLSEEVFTYNSPPPERGNDRGGPMNKDSSSKDSESVPRYASPKTDKEGGLLINLEEDETEYLKMYDHVEGLPMNVCLAEEDIPLPRGMSYSEENRTRVFSEADVRPPIWGPEDEERLPALTLEEKNEYDAIYEDIDAQVELQERGIIGWLNWSLSPWSEVKKECTQPSVLYSQPLYSHTFGYKFRIAVTVGDNFRVYLQLMKGEYDARLQWPFKGKVTVSVVKIREPHKKNSLHCTIDAKKAWFSRFFQRPAGGEGNQELLLCFSPTLKDIESQKKGFLFMDTITLRAVVVPL